MRLGIKETRNSKIKQKKPVSFDKLKKTKTLEHGLEGNIKVD